MPENSAIAMKAPRQVCKACVSSEGAVWAERTGARTIARYLADIAAGHVREAGLGAIRFPALIMP